MSLQPNKLCLVIPCYNEESILQDTIRQLLSLLQDLEKENLASEDSCMLLVNDGSSDKTWEIIENASNGNDIVYGVRNDRSSDTFFKRLTAETFYKLMQWLGVKTIYNHADFRLMSKRAVKALLEYSEVNLYIRGLVPILGFRQAIVFYKRKPADRPTHYPLSKMLLLAWEGITSFSIRPIRAITFLGVIMMAICFLLFLYILYSKFVGFTVAGWTSLAAVTLLLGSFQLLSVGIIGEYIAKIYLEVKRRPRFLIQKKTGFEDK